MELRWNSDQNKCLIWQTISSISDIVFFLYNKKKQTVSIFSYATTQKAGHLFVAIVAFRELFFPISSGFLQNLAATSHIWDDNRTNKAIWNREKTPSHQIPLCYLLNNNNLSEYHEPIFCLFRPMIFYWSQNNRLYQDFIVVLAKEYGKTIKYQYKPHKKCIFLEAKLFKRYQQTREEEKKRKHQLSSIVL